MEPRTKTQNKAVLVLALQLMCVFGQLPSLVLIPLSKKFPLARDYCHATKRKTLAVPRALMSAASQS